MEAKTIGFNIMSSLREEYSKENRDRFIEEWRGNANAIVENLPADVRERFCFTTRMDPYNNGRSKIGKLIVRRKIDNRCISGVNGNVLLSTNHIFRQTRNLRLRASVVLPKEGTSYRFCNLHYKSYFSPSATARFREAPGC